MSNPEDPTIPCHECGGEGRWVDASHGCSRHCQTCDGEGRVPALITRPAVTVEKPTILERAEGLATSIDKLMYEVAFDMVHNPLGESPSNRKAARDELTAVIERVLTVIADV